MAARHGIETLDPDRRRRRAGALLEMTGGRGAHGVIDAVGMEAHGSAPARRVAKFAQAAAGLLPDAVGAQADRERRGRPADRAAQRHRRGPPRRNGLDQRRVRRRGRPDADDGAVRQADRSCGWASATCKKWIDDLLPLVEDAADPLGVLDLTTHQVPLTEAPEAYKMFQEKSDGCIKVVLKP